MTIEIGNKVPDATLTESTEFGEACPVSPANVSVAEATKGKRIVVFGLPGAYTPTCSAYALHALEIHGLTRGLRLIAGRLLRCRPGSTGGEDPAPQRDRSATTRVALWSRRRARSPR